MYQCIGQFSRLVSCRSCFSVLVVSPVSQFRSVSNGPSHDRTVFDAEKLFELEILQRCKHTWLTELWSKKFFVKSRLFLSASLFSLLKCCGWQRSKRNCSAGFELWFLPHRPALIRWKRRKTMKATRYKDKWKLSFSVWLSKIKASRSTDRLSIYKRLSEMRRIHAVSFIVSLFLLAVKIQAMGTFQKKTSTLTKSRGSLDTDLWIKFALGFSWCCWLSTWKVKPLETFDWSQLLG